MSAPPHTGRAREGWTVGSLFAGIGGFDLAARNVGWRTAWYSEIDPYACRVMAKHFPDAVNLGDITTITNPPRVDVLCGGFPCQDISYAGDGAGIAVGTRSGLWYEYARLIAEVRPTWVVAENVAALRTRGLDTVLRDLDALGYVGEWHCIPAAAVGAPHQRDRLWIVAHAGSQQHEGAGHAQRGATAAGFSQAMAHPSGQREREQNDTADTVANERHARMESGSSSFAVPDADLAGLEGLSRHVVRGAERQETNGPAAPARLLRDVGHRGDWATEPDVGRVAHGVPARVDRLRCLGNAIVPQVAEVLFRAINEVTTTQAAA